MVSMPVVIMMGLALCECTLSFIYYIYLSLVNIVLLSIITLSIHFYKASSQTCKETVDYLEVTAVLVHLQSDCQCVLSE